MLISYMQEEDEALIEKVKEFGDKAWAKIASKLGYGRTGKQCRERFHNHLRPDIKKGSWTLEEEKLLEDAHMRLGNK